MRKKRALFLILFGFELAVLIPLGVALVPSAAVTRRISVNARRFAYAPARIRVNRGDTVILAFSTSDVTHGFALDGYPLELIASKGVTFQRDPARAAQGHLKSGWSRVSTVKFVAYRTGKFVFRCSRTCGNLHPFMTGELIVRPNTAYHLMVSLSVWLVFSLLVLFRRGTPPWTGGFRHRNLLERFPLLKRLAGMRALQFLVILPNFTVFYLFILSSLWGSPVGNRNIAIVFVWILWWFVLKAILVPLGGRIWCLVCPLPAPAEWLSRRRLAAVRYVRRPYHRLHHRFSGLQRDWPVKWRNVWLQNILFLVLISFGMILITRPIATALLFLAILLATLVLALVFRQRVFCLYLCPVGGFLGTYSMAAMTEVRPVDADTCRKHREKPCLAGSPRGWACPWNQYVGRMPRNNRCGLCTECIKSCPKDNVAFFLRPFGSDLHLAGYDEMFNVIIMLVVALAFSVTMLGPWGFVRDAANVTETRQVGAFLVFLAAVWGSALGVFPALFFAVTRGAWRLSGRCTDYRALTLRLAYILLPLGIFAWIAFSLPAIMVNYGYILSVFSDPMGLGWDLLGTADVHFRPFIPEWIPLIQGLLLLAGLYLGLSRGYHGLGGLIEDPAARTRAMVLPALFALAVTHLFLRLYMG